MSWTQAARLQRKAGYTAEGLLAEVAQNGDPNACFACGQVFHCYDARLAGRDNKAVMRLTCYDCAPAVLNEITASMRDNPPLGYAEVWGFKDFLWFQENPERNFRLRTPFPGEVWHHCGPTHVPRLRDHLKVFCIVQKSLSDGSLRYTIVAVPEAIADDDNLLSVMVGLMPSSGDATEWIGDLDETHRIAATFGSQKAGTA
jgi:hypothetical protein